MKKSFNFILMLVFVLAACSVEKRDIKYGTEVCQFCKMIIVDNQYASEIITTKGKVHVYDAIECMLNSVSTLDNENIALYYVSDYSSPGKLIDATQSYYIQTDNLPSPMGDNLTAFEEEGMVVKSQSEKGGVIYNWMELREKYKVNK